MTRSPRHILAVGALCLSAAGVSALGAQDAPPANANAPKLVPLVKLQTAVRARDRARAEVRALRYQLRRAERLVGLIDHPTPESNRRIARLYFGAEFSCAAKIISGESGWLHDVAYGGARGAHLIYSGLAYGLPQARPGTKMLSAGGDAASNPLTQLRWMRSYAEGRYGSVCAAAGHWTAARSW